MDEPRSIPPHPSPSEPALLASYAVVAARRATFDTMMWQVPALATAAQAFLLATALNSSTARGARLVTASLAFALAVLAAQLMAKHRTLETRDSRMAEQIERLIGVDQALGVPPSASVKDRLDQGHPWWIRMSSFRLWMLGLSLFAIADLVIFCAAAFGVRIFS